MFIFSLILFFFSFFMATFHLYHPSIRVYAKNGTIIEVFTLPLQNDKPCEIRSIISVVNQFQFFLVIKHG